MGRSKWKGEEPHHVRLYVKELLNTPAWAALSISARVVYVEMRAKLGKTNNGDVSYTMKDVRQRATFNSPTTLAAALAELRVLGFVKVTRQGRVSAGSKIPTLYAFTNEPVREFAKDGVHFGPWRATFDYQHFKTLEDAQQALRDGRATLKDEARKRNKANAPKRAATLQKMKQHASDFASKQASIASEIGSAADSSLQKVESYATADGGLTNGTPLVGTPGRQWSPNLMFPDHSTLARLLATVACATCGAAAGQRHTKSKCELCPKCGALGYLKCQCGGRVPTKAMRAGRMPGNFPEKENPPWMTET